MDPLGCPVNPERGFCTPSKAKPNQPWGSAAAAHLVRAGHMVRRGWQHRSPRRWDTDTSTSLHQEREQQHHRTPQYCRTPTELCGCNGGVARHGAPTPCIPRAPSREGQGETEARFTSQPLAPGYPPAVPTALSSVSGKWGTQAAPPACSHTPGMAPEPARGSGPTRRHPVAELVPLGPTAAGAAPAGDSTQGRPCPDLHQPPGPRTGRGGPATPRPTGFSPAAGAAGHSCCREQARAPTTVGLG